jgi:hypothetical protein
VKMRWQCWCTVRARLLWLVVRRDARWRGGGPLRVCWRARAAENAEWLVMVAPRQKQPTQEDAGGSGCNRRTLSEGHGGICADVRYSVRGRASSHAGALWLSRDARDERTGRAMLGGP